MIIAEACYDEMINNVARSIGARVELLEGDSILQTFEHDGALQYFSVERIGDSAKFFGYGICQKLTVKLRDKNREINIVKGQKLDVAVGVGCDYLYTFPVFFVEEVKRNENTNELEVIAYDAIFRAASHKVSEVVISAPYTLYAYAAACTAALGMPMRLENVNDTIFDTDYPTGANFSAEGTETIREALDDIAEATGTVYYMCRNWCITFKRLDVAGDPVLNIDKHKYFTLDAKTVHTLQNITSTNELGDAVTIESGIAGEHQYIRDNVFLEMREDIADLLQPILNAVQGLSIAQFDCKWRGNFLLEIGDKISLVTKDDQLINTYLLNDIITYNGGLTQKTKWDYSGSGAETLTNPVTLGDTLKATYARVDKANRKIELVASETTANAEAISSLQISTGDIMASVSDIEKNVNATIDGVNEDIGTLRKEVETKITNEALNIAIRTELSNGVTSVKTETGYTFDGNGLHIAKEGEEMQNTLDNTGMYVKRGGEDILAANNNGVEALNVVVKTWLIVGDNSRFENYEGNRTGCFYIG
jgi:hypothetical protein